MCPSSFVEVWEQLPEGGSILQPRGSCDQTGAIKLGGKHLYLLRHLAWQPVLKYCEMLSKYLSGFRLGSSVNKVNTADFHSLYSDMTILLVCHENNTRYLIFFSTSTLH